MKTITPNFDHFTQLNKLQKNCDVYIKNNYQTVKDPQTEEKKLLYESSLYEFFKASWHVIEPGKDIYLNWHQEAICEYLEYFNKGHINKLLINIAPRHLKSIIVTINFPVWEWLSDPTLRYLCLSYSSRLSVKHNLKRRTIIRSNWFQSLWGHKFELSGDNNLKTEFSNNFQGQMFASSFGGTVLGEGGDRIIVDDPHHPEELESDNVREGTVSEFDDVVGTRLNDPNKGGIITVMQRLHDKDISGHTLAEIGGYTHLCLPTIAEEDQRIIFPMSGRYVDRKKGTLLHEERFGWSKVKDAQKVLGSYKFAGRHQQRPVPASGGIVSPEWIVRYKNLPALKRIIQSWDTAQKDKTENDNWACTTWGESYDRDYYLIHSFIGKFDYVKGKRAFCSLYDSFLPDVILIEDKSTGSSLIQEARKPIILDGGEKIIKIDSWIVGIIPKQNKEVRMEVEATAYENKRVHHPYDSPWLAEYERDLFNFPKGVKDSIDSTSQFLGWVRQNIRDGVANASSESETENILQMLR
jgi:phage terminase large subunit-like protein